MKNIINISLKLCLLIAVFTLSACATLYNIPGLDRIIPNTSKAQVGPVKNEQGEIIQGTETGVILDVPLPNERISKTIEDDNVTANNMATKASIPSRPAPTVNTPIQEEPRIADTPLRDKPASIERPLAEKAPVSVPSPSPALGSISGKVTLLASTGAISPEGVIVRIKRKDGTALATNARSTVHNMDMTDKVYTPGNMIIRKGDTVNFVNNDEIQHNVFSSTGENAFDLGTFGSGLQRAVRLNEEGVVKVYCNIHPNMAAYVAVDDEGISQVLATDEGSEEGSFEFSNLPMGDYIINLWSIRGTQSQEVSITNSDTVSLDIQFDTRNYEAPERLNKFGEDYNEARSVRREFY
ncbi:plastocyanin/azurin family copper-binding protein [Ningiella sp. W23]|uniref:cupredoxin domain-containing protein n=1 Tax=Ningiella sp. W23 TaxID=3023715 RepID=UPI00375789E1